jgi:hypothetical protein
MAVSLMSKQEFSRLDVLLRVQSGGLRISDACVLIGLQRHQGVSFAARPQAGRARDLAFQTPRQIQQPSAPC